MFIGFTVGLCRISVTELYVGYNYFIIFLSIIYKFLIKVKFCNLSISKDRIYSVHMVSFFFCVCNPGISLSIMSRLGHQSEISGKRNYRTDSTHLKKLPLKTSNSFQMMRLKKKNSFIENSLNSQNLFFLPTFQLVNNFLKCFAADYGVSNRSQSSLQVTHKNKSR